MSKKISIILCTYNEVNYIESAIQLIYETLDSVEIIVVDDNSKDGTLEKLDKLKSKFNFNLIVRKNERGLASAQKRGFEASTGDYVGTIDVNSRDQILIFPELISKLDSGYDLASLSRYIEGGGDQRIFLRSFASKSINLVSKFFLRISFNDFTSGIFLMKRELLKPLNEIITGYSEWFIEFIYILNKRKFKMAEVPYIQKQDEKSIDSKSYPNIFTFFYLGSKYFLRVLVTLFRN